MNRFFGIILLLIIFSVGQVSDAKIFNKKNPDKTDYVRDFDEVKIIEPMPEKFKSPDVPDVEEDEAVLEGNATTVDKEDVDLDEIDDELPENQDIDNDGIPDIKENNPPKTEKKEQTKPLRKEIDGNIEAEFNLFDNFNLDKDGDNKIDEDTLLGKIINRDIIRTDVPSYLLRDELTFRYKKGLVSKVQYYGTFQGNLSSFWNAGDYDTSYDMNFLQFGAIGKFRHTKNDFKVMINPRPSSNLDLTYMQNFIADAYIINSSIPHHKVVVGYSRNQIGKEGGSSSYILPFAMRSQIARNFGSTRALGVRLIGNYSLMDYNLAFNSSDRFFHTPFAGPEFTGWVDFKPLGRTDGRYGNLIMGGGLNAGHNRTNYTVGSFYIGYKYKRLWTNCEYGIADGYNGSYVSTDRASGFNYTIGYKIHPRLQLIARYDQFDPDRDVKNNTRREYTAGINYFIKGQALRLILNYVFCDNQGMADSHRIILGTQILL